MRLSNMRERIELWGTEPGKTSEGIATKDQPKLEYRCYTEVLNTPIREYRNPSDKVGLRKESPVFIIRFNPDVVIDTTWTIRWRGQFYEIIGTDPDYDKRTITKIEARAINNPTTKAITSLLKLEKQDVD